jgi:hypothetical protein
MPRRDTFHDSVRNALIKDGWTITHDPLKLPYRRTDVYIDLGAETPFGAEKDGRKIAVEIKMFRGQSDIHDLENALGQYRLYRFALARNEPDRVCYLAITNIAYAENFSDMEAQELMASEDLRLIVFNPTEETILRWIPQAT